MIWTVVFISAFSISGWRRGLYLLPIYPSLAVLFGIGLYNIIPTRYSITTVCLIAVFFFGNITAPFLFPHWEPKSVGEVVFKNTYLPGAKKALESLRNQLGFDTKLVSFGQNNAEAVFFFSEDFDVEPCGNVSELRHLVESKTPIIIYISKKKYANLDESLQSRLKIVYSFSDNLFVVNKIGCKSVY